MADNSEKNYPPAPSEISKIMGLSESGEAQQNIPAGHAPAGNLPVVEIPHAAHEKVPAHKPTHVEPGLHDKIEHQVVPDFETSAWSPANVVRVIAPYAAVFLVGVFLYFFFFTKFDFYSLFQSKPSVKQSSQDSALQQLEKQNMAAYNTWIQSYYYDISDSKIIDPEADNSGNGLSNFQKFLLNLNPKSYDTMGLGMADSEALQRGINPLSGLKLTDKQQQIVDKYFDMETIQNKLMLAKMNGTAKGMVAGAQVYQQVGTTTLPSDFQTGNPNSGTNTDVKSAAQTAAPATALSFQQNAAEQIVKSNLDIDTAIPGRLEIPSIHVNVPIIWSADSKNFDNDLKSGVIHYPGTALPGQIGTTYISGHSSNYVWVKGSYNRIFAKLNDAPDASSFKITVVQKNGKNAILHYVVTGRKEFQPNDIAQFANTGKSTVALSTCWPVNTTQKRLLLYGELTQVEQ